MSVLDTSFDRRTPDATSRFTLAEPVTSHTTRSLTRRRWRSRATVLGFDGAGVACTVALGGMTGRTALGFAVLSFLVLTAIPIKLAPKVMRELPELVARAASAALAAQLLLGEDGARSGLLWLTVISVLMAVLARTVAYRTIRAMRSRGKGLEPTIIVGSGVVAKQLAVLLEDHPEYGLDPVGFVDSAPSVEDPLPRALLGGLTELGSVLHSTGVRRVIVAYSGHRDSVLADVLRSCLHLRVEVYLVPRFFDLGVPVEGRWADEVWGIPLSRMGQSALRTVRCKRVFDLLVALVGVVLAAPLLALCALAVRASSPGPVLFRQRRVGRGGREFDVLKFRSMRVNDDAATTWNVAADDRRTRFGRFLRNSSLDELPQLFNVLRGEMSIVGPRPERPYFVERFTQEIPQYCHRHRVPPGITGLAQVNGLRGDTSIADRVRHDNRYIDDWSLWRDVAIILSTARTLLPGQAR